MKRINDDDGRRLMDKFLAGSTSNAEERMLHDYFAQEDVAEEMMPYREMMAWYAALEGKRVAQKQDVEHRDGLKNRRSLMRWVTIAVSAAAAIAVVAVTGISRFMEQDEVFDDEMLKMYAGSYIVRDGKKVTDLKKVLPVILEMERMTAKMRVEARSEFTDVQESMQNRLYEVCDSIAGNTMAVE